MNIKLKEVKPRVVLRPTKNATCIGCIVYEHNPDSECSALAPGCMPTRGVYRIYVMKEPNGPASSSCAE